MTKRKYKMKLLLPDMEVTFNQSVPKGEIFKLLNPKCLQHRRYKMKWSD